MQPARTYDAIIVGAGAAGMYCAAIAGQRGRRILLIDHSPEPRRQDSHLRRRSLQFHQYRRERRQFPLRQPAFRQVGASRHTPADFLALVERHGIAWHEKTLGQLFCDGSAKQIVAMLLDECARGRSIPPSVQPATVDHRDGLFHRRRRHRPGLVLATGGLSIPKLGATSFAYDIARRFGLKIVEPRPALVPLTLSGEERLVQQICRESRPRSSPAPTRAISRGRLVHPPRPQRPRHPAGLVLLAKRRRGRNRLPPRSAERLAQGGQARRPAHQSPPPAGRASPRAPRGDPRRPARLRCRTRQYVGQGARRRRGPPRATGASPPTAARASPRPK